MWIYGRHAVAAALQNPHRHQHKLIATKNALDWLADQGLEIPIEPSKPHLIDSALPPGAVHQGLAIKVNALKDVELEDVCDAKKPGPVVVLDQVTDPQNIGALFRVGAAFSAQAMVAQDRRTPPLSGPLAKAAVGAIESLPLVRVVNIARSLEALREIGFHTIGLAAEAETDLPDFQTDRPVAIVMGAEGSGLRPLVKDTCESLMSIPISDSVESLNVATAAGITLYGLVAQKSSA
ncbi:MAG: 23S rRNA (guanosine(2251)-2'-O)-methyltransferase RlmB [Pseudomonadota bacterium]